MVLPEYVNIKFVLSIFVILQAVGNLSLQSWNANHQQKGCKSINQTSNLI